MVKTCEAHIWHFESSFKLLIELVNQITLFVELWLFYFRLDKEFHGFQRLFTKYLETDVDTSIDWEKIEKLPADSVSQLY